MEGSNARAEKRSGEMDGESKRRGRGFLLRAAGALISGCVLLWFSHRISLE